MNVLQRLAALEEAVRRLQPTAGDGMEILGTLMGTVFSVDYEALEDEFAETGMFQVLLEDGEDGQVAVCRDTDLSEPEDPEDDRAGVAVVNNHTFLVPAWRHSAAEGTVCLHFRAPEEPEDPVQLLPPETGAEEDYGSCAVELYDGLELPPATDTDIYYPIALLVADDDGRLEVTQAHRPLGSIVLTWQGPCYDLLRTRLQNGHYDE